MYRLTSNWEFGRTRRVDNVKLISVNFVRDGGHSSADLEGTLKYFLHHMHVPWFYAVAQCEY